MRAVRARCFYAAGGGVWTQERGMVAYPRQGQGRVRNRWHPCPMWLLMPDEKRPLRPTVSSSSGRTSGASS